MFKQLREDLPVAAPEHRQAPVDELFGAPEVPSRHGEERQAVAGPGDPDRVVFGHELGRQPLQRELDREIATTRGGFVQLRESGGYGHPCPFGTPRRGLSRFSASRRGTARYRCRRPGRAFACERRGRVVLDAELDRIGDSRRLSSSATR